MKCLFVLTAVAIASISLHAQDAPKMFYQDVAWSPDGKCISATGLHDYVKDTDGFKTDIYVMRTDGSNLTKITDDVNNDYYTSLSKKRIAYSSGLPKSQQTSIFTANLDGSDRRQITPSTGKDSAPAFSPDGKWIAFMSVRDAGKYQIYVMKADGSEVRKLTDDPSTSFCNPQWSPDGKRILFYTDKGDRKDQVWVMEVDGSNKRLLTGGIAHNIFPGWSPDGKKVIFSSSNRDGGNASYVDGSYLYTVNADGSGFAPLGKIKSFFARFSPDGKKLAYITGGFPESSIYVANADGTGPTKITK